MLSKGYATPEPEIDDRPSIYVTSEQVPVIKGWKVGGKYSLKVDVEETSMTKERGGLLSATLKIDDVNENDDSDENEDDGGN